MQYNPEELDEILNIYKVESDEIIQGLNENFLELEKNPSEKSPLKKLFQLSHSLKGASRMIGFNNIQDIAHKLEDVLAYWKNDNVKIDVDSFQIIYEVCDFLSELIEKSVKNKSEIQDNKVLIYINKLNSFINSNEENNSSAIVENVDNVDFTNKSIDINAIILELMFVIARNNINSEIEEVSLVIYENIKQLSEIFDKTKYIYIKEEIFDILNLFNNEGYLKTDFENVKSKIIKLKNQIYKLYKELNLNSGIANSSPSSEIVSEENNHTEEEKRKDSEKEINDNFDFILSNLPKIKYDKNCIDELNDKLNKIVSLSDDSNINNILNRTINILNLFSSNKCAIDNDCYLVILQCIYLAKRVSINKKDESLYNLNFLMQRLNVVQDMLDVNESNKQELVVKKNTDVLTKEDYSNLKDNMQTFALQEIKTLRIDVSKLDNLISQTGELLVNGIKNREHIIELSKINAKLLKWHSVSKKIINYIKYLEKKGFFASDIDEGMKTFYKRTQNFFYNNADLINEINNDFVNLYNIVSEDGNKLHQTAMEIETIAKGIRVLPLATIFHSFPRMIRDIAKENDKKIDFVISGSDTTIDKKIIEEIKMPLIHILRNAVSHGIEHPSERLENNKRETGLIKLTAKQIENNLVITVEDDGYGVNISKVKEIALKKGLLSEDEIMLMDNEQIMKLLFLPGFSTEDSINEISGRGVGLDVVKSKITNLNGDILIDSVLGKGCKVTIKLPLSMSTTKAFILLINEQKYAIPVNLVKFVKQIKKEEIFDKNSYKCIIFEGHSIPVYTLAEIIDGKSNEENKNSLTVIIIENQDKQAAFIVDDLIGDQDIFQKKLVPPILKIRNISGFTTLSTGEICLVLNPYELISNTILNINNQIFISKDINTEN